MVVVVVVPVVVEGPITLSCRREEGNRQGWRSDNKETVGGVAVHQRHHDCMLVIPSYAPLHNGPAQKEAIEVANLQGELLVQTVQQAGRQTG
jgi:hypothetical protein